MQKVNIVIMGKTGVGKSTLVNAVFQKKLAETGIGSAVTLENTKYSERIYFDNQLIELTLFDTVGLELDAEKNRATLSGIQSHISSQENETINIIWYCIDSNSSRYEQYEDDLLKQLRYNYEIPYIIVLTKSINSKSVEKLTQKLLSWDSRLTVVPILADNYETDAGSVRRHIVVGDNRTLILAVSPT